MSSPPFQVAVDLVVLTVRGGELCLLTVRRGVAPHEGRWALPGGFVRPDEGLFAAAARELAEETGIDGLEVHLEQLASYGDPDRDPRGRVVAVAHLALVPDAGGTLVGSDARAARWTPVAGLDARAGRSAFDHARIAADGIERARAKLEYTPLGAAFCDDEFTIGELRGVYEAVWGTTLDPRNFHRKVTGADGFLEPTGRTTTRQGGRPAQLYRRGSATMLHPAALRPAGDRG